MCSQTLRKFEKITEGNRFKFLYSRGKKLVLPSFVMYLYVDPQIPGRRLGVTVSKKMGKSVVRSRAKRLLRELFRRNKSLFPEHADVVMVARQGLVEKSYSELEKELYDGLKSLEMSKNQDNT